MASSIGQPWTGSLTGRAKYEAVVKLMDELTTDLDQKNLTTQQRDAALEKLKVYGRDRSDADPIFTNNGIGTLTRHAFDTSTASTSRNALRCLANAMLIKPEARQLFVDLGYESKACAQLKRDDWDDEFLCSRVIFLTTYGTNVDLASLIVDHGLAATIIQKLARHATLSAKRVKFKADPMQDMALTEILKLMFNVTHFCKLQVDSFTPAVPHILTLLTKRDPAPSQPLDGPFSPLINALVNLRLESREAQAALFPDGDRQNSVVKRLLYFLDLSMKAYKDADLEQTVTPLLTVFRTIYQISPGSVRDLMRSKILPAKYDREKILGRGESLPARLLRNSTNPMTPSFRDAISQLLFDISGQDASRFVENVGYGFAAGFLFQNNIPFPKNAAAADGRSGSGSRPVNPITGQFLDQETGPDVPEMTQEEKEREAERLFDLFERLKRTGIVDVENPVEQAIRDGRFQNMKDDDRVEELD